MRTLLRVRGIVCSGATNSDYLIVGGVRAMDRIWRFCTTIELVIEWTFRDRVFMNI